MRPALSARLTHARHAFMQQRLTRRQLRRLTPLEEGVGRRRGPLAALGRRQGRVHFARGVQLTQVSVQASAAVLEAALQARRHSALANTATKRAPLSSRCALRRLRVVLLRTGRRHGARRVQSLRASRDSRASLLTSARTGTHKTRGGTTDSRREARARAGRSRCSLLDYGN